jgi:hypothetical protein
MTLTTSSVTQSSTKNDEENTWGAKLAIDGDLDTRSETKSNHDYPNELTWFMVKLGNLYCVTTVVKRAKIERKFDRSMNCLEHDTF